MGPVKTVTRHPDYSATKLALHSTAATVVQELGNSGVTCNILMSGLYESEALLNMFHRIARENGIAPDAPDMLPQVLRIIGSHIPQERGGTADEMASTACSLVSQRDAAHRRWQHRRDLDLSDYGGNGVQLLECTRERP